MFFPIVVKTLFQNFVPILKTSGGVGVNYIVREAQILEIYVAKVTCTLQVRRSAVGLWPRPAQAVCERECVSVKVGGKGCCWVRRGLILHTGLQLA